MTPAPRPRCSGASAPRALPHVPHLGQRPGRAAPGPGPHPRRHREPAPAPPHAGHRTGLPAGGLLATKIHLKHVSACTVEGYSARPGGAQAKLLAEIGEAEGNRNLDLIRAEFGNYQNGIMPAGPGARELTAFFAHVDGDLAAYDATAPNVAATDQHLLNLLTKRAGVLHIGPANYCWVQRAVPGVVLAVGRHSCRRHPADRHV